MALKRFFFLIIVAKSIYNLERIISRSSVFWVTYLSLCGREALGAFESFTVDKVSTTLSTTETLEPIFPQVNYMKALTELTSTGVNDRSGLQNILH